MSKDTAADNFIQSLVSDAYESSSQDNNNNKNDETVKTTQR